MALEAFRETLDGLSEVEAGHYVQVSDGSRAGQFRLDVTPVDGFQLDNPGNLRTALSRERENVRKRDQQLAAWGELDPAVVAPIVERVTELGGLDSIGPAGNGSADAEAWQAKIDEAKRLLTEKHAGEKSKWTDREKKLLAAVDKHLRRNVARAMIAKHGGNEALLLPPVLERLQMKEADGEFALVVLDEHGREAISLAEGSDAPMSPDELVGSVFKKDKRFGVAFDGTEAVGSGGGGDRTGGGGGTTTTSGRNHFISHADAQDVAKYRRAREAAEKAGVELEVGDDPRWGREAGASN